MKSIKIVCLFIASTSVLAIAPTTFANSGNITNTSAANRVDSANSFGSQSLIGGTGGTLGGHVGPMLFNSSETATFFYKKGIKNFEKGNLEKSESAFEVVLRADGSKQMNKLTFNYLKRINEKQGDFLAKEKYAEAYSEIDKK